MSIKFDLSLYLVTDSILCGAMGVVATAEAAIRGGVTMLQLRGPRDNLRQLLDDAIALRDVARHHGIPFVVNDHVDIALAVQADGVHVGQDDMPAAFARQLLGREKIVGISITSVADLPSADPAVVDYVGLGPVFATTTKLNAAPALGLDGFRGLRQRVGLPVVAIGGLNLGNIAGVMAAGADGVAVVSAICGTPDPARAARDLRQIVRGGQT
nr:thiamine phosphate synthase [uncultured Dongia sp.]